MAFLGGLAPPLYSGFPGVRPSAHLCVHVIKLVEAEMTVKTKVVSVVEKALKRHFSYAWDSSRT